MTAHDQQENDWQGRSSSSWQTDWKGQDKQTTSRQRARSTGDLGTPWTKRSRQGWSYAEDDEEYWHNPDDKEWYGKNHSWKRTHGRRRAYDDDYANLSKRVDDQTKLSMGTLDEHQAIVERCPYAPTWRGNYPDYKGNWKRRVFEKGIKRVITDD